MLILFVWFVLDMFTLTRSVVTHINQLFAFAIELVRDCTFLKTESSAGTGLTTLSSLSASVKALVGIYFPREIDGAAIRVGDERIIIRASELANVPAHGSGDFLFEPATFIWREIVSARLDFTGTFWTIQTRRSQTEDWGDLTGASLFENWGDLAAATITLDWQT